MRRAIIIVALLSANAARANPLSLANFGGLRGDPVYTGAFALYWNPAALAGTNWDVALDAQIHARQASYDRDAVLNAIPEDLQAANAGRATINTVGAVPGIAGRWGRDVGRIDIGIGFGVFVENGGTASWDKNYRAPSNAPGAIDGPQRWATINAQLLAVDLAAGIAIKDRTSGFSFGFTPILVVSSFQTTRARNIDSSEDLVDAQGQPKEGRAYFNGKGVAFSAILGARWDIRPGWAVAATYQRGARMSLDGNLNVAFGTQAPSSEKAVLEIPIADTVRLGAELRATRWLSLRPMFEVAIWEILKAHNFVSKRDGSPLLVIPRDSGNSYALRLRADFRIRDRWRLMLGIGYEKGPTPSSTMEPGFGEPSSIDVGAGAIVALSHYVDLSAAFMYRHYFTFNVYDSIHSPSMNGTYRDNRESFLIHLEVHGWHASVR